jgi:uncharacterized protein YbbC (DUF1343 family)
MKKIFIFLIVALMFPFISQARVEVGSGLEDTCITSNYKGYPQGQYCRTTPEIFKRIANLEERMNDVEDALAQCQANQTNQTVTQSDSKYLQLELRLQVLENAVKTLNDNLTNSFKTILSYLFK